MSHEETIRCDGCGNILTSIYNDRRTDDGHLLYRENNTETLIVSRPRRLDENGSEQPSPPLQHFCDWDCISTYITLRNPVPPFAPGRAA
jgi:hypothetical protein